jgi:hypothetical protein
VFTAGSLLVSLLFTRPEFADYAFASGLVSVLYFAVDGLTAAATPSLARQQRTAGATDTSFVVYAALAWLVPTVYWVAEVAVTRFLPGYAPSIPLLRVLCVSLPLSLIVRSRVVAVATAAGRQRELLVFALCGLGVTAAVCGAALPSPDRRMPSASDGRSRSWRLAVPSAVWNHRSGGPARGRERETGRTRGGGDARVCGVVCQSPPGHGAFWRSGPSRLSPWR